MKKQIRKLSLNKKTISNLKASEMAGKVGGSNYYCTYSCRLHCSGGATRNGNTCLGHNTCYNC